MSSADRQIIDLGAPLTQTAFGALVGVAQPTVSDLVSRGVLRDGDPLGQWLADYCEHMRKMAAGRDQEGPVSTQRARLIQEQADQVAMRNAIKRREYMPVALLEEVLANVCRQIASQLDSILPNMLRRFPYLSGEPARYIGDEINKARERAAMARFAPPDDEEDADDAGEEEAAA